MVSVARWLETFTCSKYADQFERLGYSTLQSICQLTSTQLQNLGVSPSDIYIIMENILLLKQSVNSLKSRQCLDLTSEPPPSFSFQSDIINDQYLFNDFPSQQQSMSEMIYYHDFSNKSSQQFIYPNQRILRSSSDMINSNPLESLERLVHLPECQVIDPKSIINESISTTPIVSNLLTNGLKRCLSNDEQNELNKKIRLNTNLEDSLLNNHPFVTSLLTRNLNNSISQTPLPSITSLQQKHHF